MEIFLELGDEKIPARVLEESSLDSKHTGCKLKQLEVEIVAKSKLMNDQLLAVIETGKQIGINSTAGNGNVIGKWKLTNNSYSYSTGTGDSNYYHTIRLEEKEDIKVTNLIVNKVELQPYSYNEEFDDDALIINAKVLLSEQQTKTLHKLMNGGLYFPVIRKGVSDTPLQMRFGQVLWSNCDGGTKQKLMLVEEKYDEKNKKIGLFEPQMTNMQTMLAENIELVAALSNMLVEKNILNMEDINKIREKAKAKIQDRENYFYEVKDIDE
jgi:hypothetical protein